MMEILGWLATGSVLLCYFLMVRKGWVQLFNLANFLGSIALGAYNYSLEAWPTLVLNLAFGAIGLYGLVRGYRAYQVRDSDGTSPLAGNP